MADDIAALERQRDDKYEEILEAIASELKLGKYNTLSEKDQERVEDEADAASDRWIEEIETQPRAPRTPLEKLLNEHYEIMMKIPDDDDEEDYEDEEEDEDEDEDEDKKGARDGNDDKGPRRR
jgi:hypothetical protein